jgi:hypothetical protein
MCLTSRNKSGRVDHYALKARQAAQFAQAIAYCRATPCRGKAALNQNKGAWPDIKWAAINRRLDEIVNDATYHRGSGILTASERTDLKDCMISAAAAGHGFRPGDRTQAVLDILAWRIQCNRGGGRKFVKLSTAAKKVVRTGEISSNFWTGFYAQFDKELEISKEVSSPTSLI